MVSVVCLAYNHEKYITKALDGFVSQKTDFAYRIIVHDDASTDGTAAIIREYAERYPGLICPIYQTENQYSKKIPIHKTHVVPHLAGKYVALCEGDDYWTDPLKLQKQFDAMEAHPECSMCTHTVREITEAGEETDAFRPRTTLSEGAYGTQQFLDIKRNYPFQTACYFMRAELWKSLVQDPPAFRRVALVGDEPLLLFMAAHGPIYYLPECMSVYRVCSIGSWSYRNQQDPQRRIVQMRKNYEMMCLYDEYTEHHFDCHLVLYRGRMLLYEKNFKELAKKENREYVKQLGFAKRVFVRLAAILPFVGKLMK